MESAILNKRRVKKPRPFGNKGYRDEYVTVCAWDTETNGLGGELLFATTATMSGIVEYETNIVEKLFVEFAQWPWPAIWYAHNAQYDWRYILPYIRENKIECEISLRNDTDIYQIIIKLEDSRIVLRDSLALYPGTLRELLAHFVPELPKLELDFEKETFDPKNSLHRAYARRDSEGLRHAMMRLDFETQKHFGVCLGHTTSGTALAAWQSTLRDGEIYDASVPGDEENFIRSGYFGGIVFLTRTDEIRDCETYDVNSSYPYQMRMHGVPWGNKAASTDWQDIDHPGIYRVKVETPRELTVPILMRRDERGYMRLSRGTFWTTATSIELQFACEHGYRVLECERGLMWESLIHPFNEFINRCEALRRQYRKQSGEVLAKLMQNSCYGKYGARRERWRVFIPEHENDTLDALPLDDEGYFWKRKETADSLRCLPQWAVWITACARLHLLRQVYSLGVENVIYGDTDSITVKKGFSHAFPQSENYGDWKLDKSWRRFRALAPKLYSGEMDTGEFKGAAKGLPRKTLLSSDWQDLLAGKSVCKNYQSLESLIVAMKHDMRPARQAKRRSSNLDNSQNWEVENNRVRPIYYKE